MTFLSELRHLGARRLAPAMLLSAVMAALTAALLTACGGGTSQVVTFKPLRLIVLGDENSLIQDFVDTEGQHDGFKYTINDRSSASTGKCLALPNFVQSVASLYGFVFFECNPTSATPKAFNLAQLHATVEGPTTGLAAQLQNVASASQGAELGASDLVTMLIGSNDIIELYERTLAGLSPTDAVADAQRRGALAAEQINKVLASGARALVITLPDLGLSPYAVNANKTNPGASALLGSLTYEFNAYLRTRIDSGRFDGRNYGLVLADDIVAAMSRLPASFLTAPSVAAVAACNIADDLSADAVTTLVLACTTTSLVADANSGSHLWASDRHLGPSAHSRIAVQAQSRAATNPF